MPASRFHVVDSGPDADACEVVGGSDAATSRAFSVALQRSAARMVRRALDSRDVPLADVAVALDVSQQRVSTLLDGDHSIGLHFLLRLAARGGRTGREVVAGVVEQMASFVDGQGVSAPTTGSLHADVMRLTRELGEFAAVAMDGAERARVRRELVDVLDAAKEAIRRFDAETEAGR